MSRRRLLETRSTELAQNQLGLLVTTTPSARSSSNRRPDTPRRTRTLNEGWDPYGRLIQIVGTGTPGGAGGTVYGMYYEDAPQGRREARQGQTRGLGHLQHDGRHAPDSLPPRQRPDPRPRAVRAGRGRNPIGGVFTPGDFAPDLNERGYKETVRMNPGEVTRVIMKFDLPPTRS